MTAAIASTRTVRSQTRGHLRIAGRRHGGDQRKASGAGWLDGPSGRTAKLQKEMRRLRGAVAVAATIGLVAALPASGGIGRPVRNGLVAFARGGGVYVLNPATGRAHRITDRAGSGLVYTDVAWSPDGRRLAVATAHALLTMNARGGRLRVLAFFSREAGLSSVAWSPDGQELAISGGFGSHRSEIQLLRLSDHRRRRVASSFRVSYYALSWTPDSRRLVYAEDSSGGVVWVYSMRTDGSDRRKIAPGGMPRLSRDGTRIAFDLGNDARTMRADGSGVRVVKHHQAARRVRHACLVARR
jgi:WD40-like Beta Propeller Repeat